jgi:N-methylhydantoinase A
MLRARIGIDVGGTFTDLVAVVDGRVVTAKVPSTPSDQSEGVLRALEVAGVTPDDVAELRHGTTVATNALLERRGARTALLTTEGFRDVVEIGRQNRPSLYDLTRDRPPPLVPRELRFTVRERMGPDGELQPLDEAGLGEALARIAEADVGAVAVSFLFGYLHPAHERRAGALASELLPDAHVAIASDVLPTFREYERTATTVASAYLGPRLAAYLSRLAAELARRGYPAPLVMQSSGGVASAEEAGARAAAVVLSGPAGGAVGGARAAQAAGFADALTLDMGGTSADVALVRGGVVATTTETLVAGVPIGFPAVDVQSVSAGGGSVAWVDNGGALRVGPRSAGAEPGPAAYGLGGTEATVTDAHVVLGHLADGATLGGSVTLHRDPAEEAVADVARRLGAGTADAALGILRVANAEMARPLRVMSVERGVDPRRLALVAFGGAGPMHACALADELGIRTVVVPRASGVLSALGLALTDVRRDVAAPATGEADLERRFRMLEREAAEGLDAAELERRADARYRGQAFELTVAADGGERLAERFHAAHEERYGYRIDDAPVELVALRVTARVAGAAAALDADGGERAEVEGPAVVALAEATCVVDEGWRGTSDETATLVLERT